MSINKGWRSCEISSYSSVTKIQDHLRRESIEYLNRHPEARAILRTLLHEAINRENTDPPVLAAALFNCNLNVTLKSKIDAERRYVIKEIQKGSFNKYDSENFLSKVSSTHSLLSNISLLSDMETILRFCLILPTNN